MVKIKGVKVTKLVNPISSGDWHDRPLYWAVSGPGTELQCFGTLKNARLYAKIRRSVDHKDLAERAYVEQPLRLAK